MLPLLRRLWAEEAGQTFVEYALLVSFVAVAVIAMMTFLGKRVRNTYSYMGNQLSAG